MHPLLALIESRRPSGPGRTGRRAPHLEPDGRGPAPANHPIVIDGAISHPIVVDGAMATMLLAAGVDLTRPAELASVEAPDVVRGIHAAYLAAGAQVIMANSFGANRVRLEPAGIAGRADELALVAAVVARRAADGDAAARGHERALVAGSLGPLGPPDRPLAGLTGAQAAAVFETQAAALAAGGADLAWLETVGSAVEVDAAVAGIGAGCDLPIVVTVTVDHAGRTPGGESWVDLVRLLASSESAEAVVAWGVNCGPGPAAAEQAITRARAIAPDALLVARPSAGLPTVGPDPNRAEQRPQWPVGPDAFAAHSLRLARSGATIIGGCCGTTPGHIAAAAAALTGTWPAEPIERAEWP